MTAETTGPDPTASLLAFFGSEVARLRTGQGLTQGQLAKKVHSTQAMISYVESGKRVPPKDLADDLDAVLGTDGHLARLYPLVVKYAYPSWFLPYVELEQAARSIRGFESQIVPGLLQTEAYARALLHSGRPDALEDLVTARMSRQEVLSREDRPRAWFILDEQALRRRVGTKDTLLRQFEALLKAAQEPRTVIQVLESRVGAHPGLEGPFSILSFDEGTDVLYVDGYSQGRVAASAEEVSAAAYAYDLLKAVASSPDDSVDLIAGYMEDLRNEQRQQSAGQVAEEQLQQQQRR